MNFKKRIFNHLFMSKNLKFTEEEFMMNLNKLENFN